MSIYQNFCTEVLDEQGNLQKITLNYPENFNFGYDVVDAIAEQTPEKRAVVWCNTEGEEDIFSFADLRELSNRAANVFLNAGIRRGDYVMVAANLTTHPRGSIVETSLGTGIVCDTGSFAKEHPNRLDIATNWTEH